MEIPTARIMKENSYRAGAGQVNPYRYYYIAMSPFKRMEISGAITEVIGVEAISSDYGNFKDKSINFKFKIIEEDKNLPAISLGIMDPQGTRVYPAQVIVASRQIYPFDFTLGFGNGRFGKRPLESSGDTVKVEILTDPREWIKDAQLFWGIQFAPSEKFSLMIEYNPIRYEKQIADPAQAKYFTSQVRSKFNYGLRWKPFKWSEIDLTYQRGDTVGLNLSMAFDMGQPLIPIYDKPYKERPKDKENPFSERLIKALNGSGFSNIGIVLKGSELWIEAQNDRYYYITKSIGVILKIVSEIAPKSIESINIVLNSNKIPILSFKTTRSDISEYFAEKITPNEFLYLSKIRTDIAEMPDVKLRHVKLFDYGLNPAFRMFLNDASGFFKYRLGVGVWGGFYPWKGASFIAELENYPLNTVSSITEPSSNPIRSDIVKYQQNSVNLARLMIDQIIKFNRELHGRFAAGLLESEYAGFDGELAMPVMKGRFYLGVSGSLVKKRDPKNTFGIIGKQPGTGDESYLNYIENSYRTTFLNARLNIPEAEVSIDLKYGRFLGGDVGSRVVLSKFINGVILSAWYSWTNTSVFTDDFNRGYHDKGIMLKFPLRLFKGSDSKTVFSYAISAWTRDVAQDINHFNTLFDFFGRNTKIYLDKDKDMIYK